MSFVYCVAAMGSCSTPLFMALVCTDAALFKIVASFSWSALLEQILLKEVDVIQADLAWNHKLFVLCSLVSRSRAIESGKEMFSSV